MNIIKTIDVICLIFTLTLFASGIPSWYNVIKTKNNSEMPFLIFLLTFTNNICSYYYGVLLDNSLIKFINFIGALFQIIYIGTYIYYSNEKLYVLKLINYIIISILALYLFVNNLTGNAKKIVYVGYIGSFVCLCAILSPLQGLFRSLHEKTSKNISLPLTLASLLCSMSWTLYGLLLKNAFILLPNFCGILVNIGCLVVWRAMSHPYAKKEM